MAVALLTHSRSWSTPDHCGASTIQITIQFFPNSNRLPSWRLPLTAEAKQLISRYVSKADTQETRLEQLNKEKQTLNGETARLQGELEAVIRGLAIDHKLTN